MGLEANRLGISDLTALVKRLTAESCDIAHVGIFDLNATFRERRVRVADLVEVFGPGGSFVNVVHQWDTGEQVYGAGPFVGEPVAIDPASHRPYPFEPGACALVADYVGPSADLSPRRLLERLVAQAHDRGLGVRAAFEFEFLMLDEDAESLRESGFRNPQDVCQGQPLLGRRKCGDPRRVGGGAGARSHPGRDRSSGAWPRTGAWLFRSNSQSHRPVASR